jgi:hypothetical protein
MNFFNSNIAIIFIFFVFKIIISPIICRFGFTIHVCQFGKHFSTKNIFLPPIFHEGIFFLQALSFIRKAGKNDYRFGVNLFQNYTF